MRKPRHFLTLLLALLLLFSFAPPVSAVSVANYTNHTYRAYQIFAGYPSQIEWGEDVNSENLLPKLYKEGGIYSDCSTAAEVAAVLSDYPDGSEEAEAFAGFCFACLKDDAGDVLLRPDEGTELVPGYYLLADENSDALSLLPVGADDLTIGSKTDETTATIQVQDRNDSTGEVSDWQDSADYDIGDAVPFQLTARITENYAQYEDYFLAFHVAESAGLTFDPDSVSILANGKPCEGYFEITADEDGSFCISCDNLRKFYDAGSGVVIVQYNSILNENAVCGGAGNQSTLRLEYSTAAGEHAQSALKDVVSVFTYRLTVRSLDGQSEPLAGADFTLCKQLPSGEIELPAEGSKDGASFTFSGLDDGQYILAQTDVPNGCTPMEPVAFEISAEHEITSDDPRLTRLSASGDGLTFTASAEQGLLSADILNLQSVILPSTGGLGTMGFYFAGGLLAGGAALLLRRRARR